MVLVGAGVVIWAVCVGCSPAMGLVGSGAAPWEIVYIEGSSYGVSGRVYTHRLARSPASYSAVLYYDTVHVSYAPRRCGSIRPVYLAHSRVRPLGGNSGDSTAANVRWETGEPLVRFTRANWPLLKKPSRRPILPI